MAIASPTHSPIDRLRSLVDTIVTVTWRAGVVTGSVLSCTRNSVWLIGLDDDDAVIPLDEILDVEIAGDAVAA